MKSYQIKEKINFHYIETNKFKTETVGIYFHIPLNEEITKASLITNMITRGIEGEITTAQLNDKFQDLFGVRAETEIRKKGDGAILCVIFDFINEKYTNGEKIIPGIFELVNKLVFNQKFGPTYLEQEKENLKNSILALINDKKAYAGERLLEEMCKGEPCSINEMGNIDDIPSITTDILQKYYEEVLLKAPIDIFFNGNSDLEYIKNQVTDITKNITVTGNYNESFIRTTVAEVNTIEESQNIAQGKLNMGFRTKIMPTDPDFNALVVMNSIFGGGVYSKLFNNVREKYSLCYYVYSRIDRYKGLMTVASGIEFSTFEKAKNEILNQFNDVKNGNISEVEYQSAILGLVNGLRSVTDSNILIQDYYLSNLIIGVNKSLEEYADELKKITVEDVVKVAQKIELDTIFFLKGDN